MEMYVKPTPTTVPMLEGLTASLLLVKIGLPVFITLVVSLPILLALCKRRHVTPTFYNSLYANLVVLCMLCACAARPTTLHVLYSGGCGDLSPACVLLQVFLLTLERVAPPLAIAMLLIERGIFFRCTSKEEYTEQFTPCRKALMVALPWLIALGAAIGVTYRLLSPAKVTRPEVNGMERVDGDCLLEVETLEEAMGVVVLFWTSILLFCFILPGGYFAYSLYTNCIQEGDQLSSSGSQGDTNQDPEVGKGLVISSPAPNAVSQLEGKTNVSLAVTIVLALLSGVVTTVGFACTLHYGWLDEPTQCAHFVLEMAAVLAALAFPETRQTLSCRNCPCSCTCPQGSFRDECESECSFTGSEGSFRRTETALVLSQEEQGLIRSSPIEPTRPRASGS